jgi:hypothetical protein
MQSDVAREVFPTRMTRGYYPSLREACGWFLFLALQTTCNSEQITLHPDDTKQVCQFVGNPSAE